MNARDYLKQPYARRLLPDVTGGYVATIQEFPGCVEQGETADEALANLELAAEAWIAALLRTGQDVPEPIAFHGYSGRVALRLPRGVHKQAAELASSEGTSINQLLVAAIANYLGGKQAFKQLSQQFSNRLGLAALQINMTNYFVPSGVPPLTTAIPVDPRMSAHSIPVRISRLQHSHVITTAGGVQNG